MNGFFQTLNWKYTLWRGIRDINNALYNYDAETIWSCMPRRNEVLLDVWIISHFSQP